MSTTTTVLEAECPLPAALPLDLRIPAWRVETLRQRACPLCETAHRGALRRPDRLPLAFCPDCCLWYVCQLPPQDEIQGIYEGYWERHRPSDLSAGVAARILRRAKWAAREDVRLQRLCAILGGLRGRSLLDVGAGMGGFLAAARELGARVFASEISPEARSFLRRRLGATVCAGGPAECLEQSGALDAIVMNDLVEHLPDPLAMLRQAWDALRGGGVLALWTPNGGAAGRRASSALDWVGFRVDLEHLQYLSAQTITVLAARQGWRIEHLETLGFPGLDGLAGRLTPAAGWRAFLRDLAFGLPAPVLNALRRGRAMARKLAGRAPADPRWGDYNLFAVLRKPCGDDRPPRASAGDVSNEGRL